MHPILFLKYGCDSTGENGGWRGVHDGLMGGPNTGVLAPKAS